MARGEFVEIQGDKELIAQLEQIGRVDLVAAAGDALNEWGSDVAGTAADLAPVDRGVLADSIEHKVNAKAGTVQVGVFAGEAVKYAEFVEDGTEDMAAQPYLRPATDEHEAEFTGILADKLEDRIGR
ncbi:HK97-gp10 family putative phage morphogenesis protein [Actinocatenispora sera]|uniref:HK97-gp10 family putative phage morphogenesis protein n=1 Tax=Actinocatenispora sera TaxID=390989 RepID=UPI0033FAE134